MKIVDEHRRILFELINELNSIRGETTDYRVEKLSEILAMFIRIFVESVDSE